LVTERNENEAWWQPDRLPIGTDNFANLLRDPALAVGDVLARELVRRGHTDVRPALLAVAAHIARDGSRVTELAARAQLTKATIVRTVDELERLGYAERVPDPVDGRAKLVRLTPEALAIVRDARGIIDEIRDGWAAAMAPGELEQLETLLRRLRVALWPELGTRYHR
jgi:DNA-binding MarR family transcriptional regulator